MHISFDDILSDLNEISTGYTIEMLKAISEDGANLKEYHYENWLKYNKENRICNLVLTSSWR